MKNDPGLLNLAAELKEPDPVPYTLRIGVTGHRNLINPKATSAAVDKLLMTINQSLLSGMTDLHQPQVEGKGKWQISENRIAWNIKRILALAGIMPKLTDPCRQTPLQWIVISSLAKGADRIVACSALENLNASLEVVLPFSVDDYRKDFSDKSDLDEFNELYERAGHNSILQQSLFHEFQSREDGYEHAGIEVTDSCEILIAVWDGQPARGRGGTAEIVKYACSVNRLVVWINALNPGLPPVLITNIQHSAKDTVKTNYAHIQVSSLPLPKYPAVWSSRYLQVAEYNRDHAFSKKEFDEIIRRNLVRFEKAREGTSLTAENIVPLLNILLPHYARADFLAIYYQKLHIRSATWLYRLSAIAVAVAVFQTLYFPAQTAWVLLEILALSGAVVWFRIGSLQHWHDKWLNYRHLAERTRIRLFKSLVGRQTTTETRQNQHLPFYSGPGSWVLDVFAVIQHKIPEVVLPGDIFPAVKYFINKGWLSDQAEYHSKNAIEKELKVKKENIIIGILLVLTFAAAIVHLFGLVHHPYIENFIIAMVIVLPAFAAAQHAIGSIRDFERIAARSARMKEILQNIEKRIENASNWDEINTELRNAEEIMSTENLEWSASLSFRRISLPV